jgi:hypothetical protein
VNLIHRSIAKRLVLLTSILTLLLFLYPIEYRSTRIATLAGLLATFAGTLILSWKLKPLRIALLTIGIIPLLALCLPARPHNPPALRAEYIRLLCTFENTRYIWGGESYLGIDCSGLVRKPLVLAHLTHGLRTLNGGLVREAVVLWWHDASALALRDGYRNWTVELSRAATLNSADHSPLQPGDLAVTADGIHILAYLGSNTWIEADPNLNRVVRITTPSENAWFNVPVILMRWRTLM